MAFLMRYVSQVEDIAAKNGGNNMDLNNYCFQPKVIGVTFFDSCS